LQTLFGPDNSINIKELKDHLTAEGRLYEKDASKIVKLAADLFRNEPNVLEVSAPITGTALFFLFFFN
jgi:hypothetical protein